MMFLAAADLPVYLLSRGLLEADQLIDGAYRCSEYPGRNRNFKVLSSGSRLFVKQAPGIFPEAVTCLEREAICYHLADTNRDFETLAAVMPRFRAHDSASHVLIIELISMSESLSALFFRTLTPSVALGNSIGLALGRMHADAPRLLPHAGSVPAFTKEPPWILTVIQDPQTDLTGTPEGHLALVHHLRRDQALCAALSFLRDGWRPTAFIHGDIKGDNILVPLGEEGSKPSAVWIVDWELASIGDPAWDVAGIITACLEACIRSKASEAFRLVQAETGYPNSAVYAPVAPLLSAFWREYARTILPIEQEEASRIRCVHYVGARLLRLSFDLLMGKMALTAEVMPVLHLARAILMDPAKADEELLGFAHSLN